MSKFSKFIAIWFMFFAFFSAFVVLASTRLGSTPALTISEVNSNPQLWIGKLVQLKGVLEQAVLEEDAVSPGAIEVMAVQLVDNSTSSAIYVYSGLPSAGDLSYLFGKSVVVTGYIKKITTLDYFGTYRIHYFIFPSKIEQ